MSKNDKIACKANNEIRRNGKVFAIGEKIDCTPEELKSFGVAVTPITHHESAKAPGGESGASNPASPPAADDVTGVKVGDVTLIGSNTLPAQIALAADDIVTLGEVVAEAFERSGMTAEQWNTQNDIARESWLNKVVDDWRGEVDSGLTDEERALRDRIRFVADAIGKMNPKKTKLWNDDGQPDLNALRNTARDNTISDAERDAAWALVLRERDAANAGAE